MAPAVGGFFHGILRLCTPLVRTGKPILLLYQKWHLWSEEKIFKGTATHCLFEQDALYLTQVYIQFWQPIYTADEMRTGMSHVMNHLPVPWTYALLLTLCCNAQPVAPTVTPYWEREYRNSKIQLWVPPVNGSNSRWWDRPLPHSCCQYSQWWFRLISLA